MSGTHKSKNKGFFPFSWTEHKCFQIFVTLKLAFFKAVNRKRQLLYLKDHAKKKKKGGVCKTTYLHV